MAVTEKTWLGRAIDPVSGNVLVWYQYDPWGKILSITGSMATTLGTLNPLTYRGYVYDHETGLYYLQSRYYNPEWGRFINADALVATGQGMLGNNMFVYCLNNPIMLADATGTRANIWPVLFGDHDPGYIHRMVQLHIVASKVVEKELYLPGVGRADIFNPNTKEIWEIKHGGNSLLMQSQRMIDAEEQAKKYVKGAGKGWNLGHANAFSGEFVLMCGSITYLISYDTPASGVILYYVQELKDQKRTVDCVYPVMILLQKNDEREALVAIGLGFVLSFAGVNNGIADPVATTAYAY